MDKHKFVYFQLWEEYFAIDVDKIIEVMEMPKMAKLPKTPDFVMGVTNFRGEIIPVIDLRKKFMLPQEEIFSKRKYVIVIEYKSADYQNKIGVVVDRIIDVIEVEQYDITHFPELGSRYNPEFIFGVIHYDDKFILVLDIEKILEAAEVEILKNLDLTQTDG